jgi:hypothetical protein
MSNPESERPPKNPPKDKPDKSDKPPETPAGDNLGKYRNPDSPQDRVERTSSEQAERAAFRREADAKLNPIFTSLEAGRNNMVALHDLAKQGQGPGTKVYEDTFKAAKQAYSQSIEQSKALLYEQGPNGELVPNKFYKHVDAERLRLAQEKQQITDKNSPQYKELASQETKMQDVLRAYGYSHANFGMALIRSSVYYPKEQRDAQKNQGHQMMTLAASKDQWMMRDPNFSKHWLPIMRAVDNTPYVTGPAVAPEVNPNPTGPGSTAELPAGYKRVQVGQQPYIEGSQLRIPTGNVVLKLDGQKLDANDPLVALSTQPPDFEKAIRLADQLDKVPLITNIGQLKEQLTASKADLDKRLLAARAQPNSPLGRYIAGFDAVNKSQEDVIKELQGHFASGLPADNNTPLTDQQKKQQKALDWMKKVQTTKQLTDLLQSTKPDEKEMADALKSHPEFEGIKSSFSRFLNNKAMLGALEDALKNAQDPAAQEFVQRRQQLITGDEQLKYLTSLYISPVTAREARIGQLRADPEVQELLKLPDKKTFTKGDDPEVKAIRQRVDELIKMQGGEVPAVLKALQQALGDTTAAATPADPDARVKVPTPTDPKVARTSEAGDIPAVLKALQQASVDTTAAAATPADLDARVKVPTPTGSEVARTSDAGPADLQATVAPLVKIEQAFTGSATAFDEMAALHRFASQVKLLRDFDAQVKALPGADRTPEKIKELKEKVFAGDEFMKVMYGPDKEPNLANEIPAALQEAQKRNFGHNQYLAQKYSLDAKPNLASEVQLDPTGKYLKEVPADVKAVFDLAGQVLGEHSPEKIQEMVAAQRQIYQMRLDNMVPKEEQQGIPTELNRLQGEFDKAMGALKPELKGPLVEAWAKLQMQKGKIGSKYLEQIPPFQSELQQVVNSTQPNTPQREQALIELQSKFMGQVEANPQYNAEIAAAEEAAFRDLKSMDPGVDAVLNAQKNLNNFTNGVDASNPNQTPQDRQARAQKVRDMDGFMTASKELDALSHTTAVVQSYQARALLLSQNPADHQKALELMTASSQDAGAARYLALPANEMQAARYMMTAADQIEKGSAPIDLFGSMVPGSGAPARGIATLTNGYIMGSRLENQNAATLALAEGYKYDPVFTQAQIAAATAEGQKAGSGLLRDGGSLAAYGGTYWASGLLKFGGKALPGPLRIIPAALAAGGASDYLKDYKVDGPMNDPGAWARGGMVGLGGHGAYNLLLGKWSTAALSQSATARMAVVGEPAAAAVTGNSGKVIGFLKSTLGDLRNMSVYANPRNMLQLNSIKMGEQIATADAAAMVAINGNLAAMSYYRTVGTAFAIGSVNHGAKIVDGEVQVTGTGDALKQMAMSGAWSGGTAGVLVPLTMFVPRVLAPIPKWGLGKVPGVMPFLSARVAPAWDAAYAMGRTYASDFSSASAAWSMSNDLELASSHAQNPDELVKAIQQANPGMDATTARARALITIQMQRGQAQSRTGG